MAGDSEVKSKKREAITGEMEAEVEEEDVAMAEQEELLTDKVSQGYCIKVMSNLVF